MSDAKKPPPGHAPDPAPGDELWVGRIGITPGMEVFSDRTVAEKWLNAGKGRRVWLVTLSQVSEYVLTPPVPPRMVPRREREEGT